MDSLKIIDVIIRCTPEPPEIRQRTKNSIHFNWTESFPQCLNSEMYQKYFLYRLQMKDDTNLWRDLYYGRKMEIEIFDLTPNMSYKIRLGMIAKQSLRKADRENLDFLDVYDNESKENNMDFKDIKRIESKWSGVVTAYTTRDDLSVMNFYMAVYGGHVKQIMEMLEKRLTLIDIWNNLDGLTPLCVAIKKGDIHICQLLLKHGADIEATSSNGQTPLITSIYFKKPEIAALLLDKGANTLVRGRNKMAMLHYAVDADDLLLVSMILGKGGNPNDTDNKGWTTLFRAVVQGANISIITALVKHGSNLDIVDDRGITCARYATMLKCDEQVQMLVNANYAHDKAVSNFAKLTTKLSNVHNLISGSK